MPLSSDPCQADHIGERPFTGNPASPPDVAAWRYGERQRLRAERKALPPAMAASITDRIVTCLTEILASLDASRLIVGASWPITAEPDLMPRLGSLRHQGTVASLSACVKPPAAMRLRRRTQNARLERGLWNLPAPPALAGELPPDRLMAPLLGWDDACNRLGFGTGSIDRTLTHITPRAYAIGVGLHAARLTTIHPLPNDRPLDPILTGCGITAGIPPLPSRPWLV